MERLQQDLEWKSRWEERGRVVREVLGDTFPPQSVTAFSWRDRILPGACALTFRLNASSYRFLYMTLGLSQPLRNTDPSYPWEFAVRTSDHADWPADLLYQLTTQWLDENGVIGLGYQLPLVFFTDPSKKLWAGITDDTADLNVVGSLRWLYLWSDTSRLHFPVSDNGFGLLTVVGVTEDENTLAQNTTPAHLILLLRRMGVGQGCDPYRRSVLEIPGAAREWRSIEILTHEAALESLNKLDR